MVHEDTNRRLIKDKGCKETIKKMLIYFVTKDFICGRTLVLHTLTPCIKGFENSFGDVCLSLKVHVASWFRQSTVLANDVL